MKRHSLFTIDHSLLDMSDQKQNTNSGSLAEVSTKLTEQELQAIDHEIEMVPYKKAAVIEALKIVQQASWLDQ